MNTLIERLRIEAVHPTVTVQMRLIAIEAADAIEALQRENEALKARWAEWKDSLNSVMEQRNALQKQLEQEHAARLNVAAMRDVLQAEVETLQYELDAVGAIKEERDAIRAELAALKGADAETYTPLYAAPQAPAPDGLADAYTGAREDLAIWKRRALEAEELNRKFAREVNGPTFMGEPAPQAPAPGAQKLIEAITNGQKQRAGKVDQSTAQIPWTHTVGACGEMRDGANQHNEHRARESDADSADNQRHSSGAGVSGTGEVHIAALAAPQAPAYFEEQPDGTVIPVDPSEYAPQAPAPKPLTKEDVRKVGGIVHGDGNIFFTNLEQLNAALITGEAQG
jgi:prefoldin subunit 5